MSVKIECILECANHLGESPIWDVEEGRLYWVDGTGIRNGDQHDPGRRRRRVS